MGVCIRTAMAVPASCRGSGRGRSEPCGERCGHSADRLWLLFFSMFCILLQLRIFPMAAEGAGGSELTQLVADHILPGYRRARACGRRGQRWCDRRRRGRWWSCGSRSSGPSSRSWRSFPRPALQELRATYGPFLMDLLILTCLPYFSLRRLTMNLLVGFLPLRVL